MRVKDQAGLAGPALIAGLSSPFEDEPARRAACAVLDAHDVPGLMTRLYPKLLKQKTLTNALAHLTAAGGDLDAITLPGYQFGSTYPLNRVLPILPSGRSGRISLAAIGSALEAHAGLLAGLVADLSEALGPGSLVVGKGQGYRARYPEYPRWCSDADVFVRDVATGIRALDALCGPMSFAMHGCKVGGAVVFKAFRNVDGHEVNVGLHAGGMPSPFLALPAAVPVSDPGRADAMTVGGRPVLVSSREDLLLTSAFRPLREGYVAIRGLNDVRYLLAADGDRLDWDDVVASARADELGDMLHHLIRAAERADGRSLCPPDVLRELEPGWARGRLFALQSGRDEATERLMAGGRRTRTQRAASALLARLWQGRYVRRRLGRVRGVVHAATDRLHLRMFKSEIRRWRARGTASGDDRGPRQPSRRRFRSVCELRAGPAPPALGFCLSRVRSGRKMGDEALQAALVRHLPDKSEEGSLGKRTTTGEVTAQPHRCESFVVHSVR